MAVLTANTPGKSVYDELTAAGCRTANHESDLYVEVSDTARTILRAAVADKRLPRYPGVFRSDDPADNGALWYEIPFAYAPFWQARLATPPAGTDTTSGS